LAVLSSVRSVEPVNGVLVENLVVRYGDVTAVDHASFAAPVGKVSVILGPNGAGKTSTIEVCEGFRRAASGHVSVLGLDPVAGHRELTERMGVMLQGGGVYPSARVRDVVAHFCALHDRGMDAGVLIERVGLSHRAGAVWRRLSGGEQQRVSLALALAARPDVAFLDEPTSGVDAEGRDAIRGIIRQLTADGCTVVLASHELAEAERIADDVVLFRAARGRTLRGRCSGHTAPRVAPHRVAGRERTAARLPGHRRRDTRGRVPPHHGGRRMRRTLVQLRAETVLVLRNGEQLLLTLVIPVLLLTFFSVVDVLPSGTQDPEDFLLPGIVALAVMSTAMVSLGIATGFERSYMVLKRLGATPLRRGELVTAKMLSVFAIELLQLAILLPLGTALGWGPEGGGTWLLVPAVLLGTAAFTGIGLTLAGTLRGEINLAAQNGLYLVLLLLGGMVIPMSSLPAPLRSVAELLPSSALADVVRDALTGAGNQPGASWVVLGVWAVAAPLVASRTFRWS